MGDIVQNSLQAGQSPFNVYFVRQAFAHPAGHISWHLMGLWLRLQEKGVIRGCCWHRPREKSRFGINSPVRAYGVSGLQFGLFRRTKQWRCKAVDLGAQQLLVGDVDGRRVARETELEQRQLEQQNRRQQQLCRAGGRVSLPPSNETAPTSASHPTLGNDCPVAFGVYAHRGILAIFRSKIPQEECEVLIVQPLADLVTVRVAHESIIAVQGRQHTVKKRSRGLPVFFESNVLGKPQPPVVIHMWNTAKSGPGSQHMVEIRQSTSQRFHSFGGEWAKPGGVRL